MNHDCIIYCIFLVHTYISTKKININHSQDRYTKCKINVTLQSISIFKNGGGVEIRICLFPDPPPGNKLFLISRRGVVLMPAEMNTYTCNFVMCDARSERQNLIYDSIN